MSTKNTNKKWCPGPNAAFGRINDIPDLMRPSAANGVQGLLRPSAAKWHSSILLEEEDEEEEEEFFGEGGFY